METPCNQICVIDEISGYCIGCGRTRHEVAGWTRMTAEKRRETMDVLADRMTGITRDRKRSGRKRRLSDNAS